MSNVQIIRGCEILCEADLPFCVNNMVGIPGETIDDLFTTLELTQRVRPCYAWFQIYQPYPRTDLAQYAEDLGLFEGNFDMLRETCHERTTLGFDRRQQRLINNAHKLFAIAVEWPGLTRLVRWLLALPENTLYVILFASWQYYFTTKRM